ncbi:MAG TPA: AraC family transcriptional regulator [Steroidobacteraceae bacterium]|nr:AraC family transcriptional regulator [Steroidobacteraceae bacterium]
MDALSDVLKSVHLEGAVYINAEFTAPWCVSAKFGLSSIQARLAGADHVLFFHYLTEGCCKVKLDDSTDALEAAAGDLILFLHEDRHLLGSDLRLVPVETARLIKADDAIQGDMIQLRHGGGGATTRFVCGYLACSQSLSRPLLGALPRVLRIAVGDGQAGTLLRELLRTGVRESLSARPGAESVLAKLSELMFVEAMRRYVESLPPQGRGWLAGVRDPQIGRTLALLHRDPTAAWTVDALARRVSLSRSALAERFTTLVGEPPMKYLKRWRLALAAQALRRKNVTIGSVAEDSGYESEAAFNRAFKIEFGLPPATWRRHSARTAAEA